MAQYSSKTSTQNYTIYLLVENVDKDISGNRSKVQYKAWITGNSGTSAWGSGDWSVSINGTSTSGSLSYNFADQKTWYCVGTATSYVKTGYIDHNDNGTKSVNVSFSFSGSTLVGSASISQSFVLDTIERVSTLSDLTTSCNTNGTLNFTINRASNNFRHSLKLSYNGSDFNEIWSEGHGTGAIQTGALRLPASAVSGVNDISWPWVPSWFKQSMVKDSITSKTATLRLDTYSGTTMNSSTLIGSEVYTITINIKRISTSSYTFSTTGSTHYTNSTITISHTTGLDTDIISKVVVRRTCNGTTKSNTFSGSAVNSDFSNLSNDFESSIIYATSGTVSVFIDVYGKYTENSTTVENKLYTYAPTTYVVTVNTSTFKPTISSVSKALLKPSEYTTNDYLAGYTGIRFTFNININGHAGLDTSKTSVSITPSSAISSYRAVATGVYEVYLNKSSSNVSISAVLSITDTRGTSTSSSSSQTFYGYTPPTFSQALVKRSNSDGTENSRGICAYFNVTAQKSSRSGTAVNLSNLKITYNGSTITSGTVDGAGPLSLTGVKGSNNYDFNNTYNFIAIATDSYGISTSITLALQKFSIPLSLHKNNGVGLGTLAVKGKVTSGLEFVPLMGSTVYKCASPGGDGTANYYLKICTINIRNNSSGNYANSPIEITFARRADWIPTRLSILFSNTQMYNGTTRLTDSTNYYSIKAFWRVGYTNLAYIVPTDSNHIAWEIYIRKSEIWDSISILNYHRPLYMESKVTIDWHSGIQVRSVPTGYIQATLKLPYISTLGNSYTPIYINNGTPTTTNAFLRVDTSTPLSNSTGYNTINGEVKFINSGYTSTGTLTDTASGIACSNKGVRYLVNELLTDGIVAPASGYTNNSFSTAANTVAFYKYTGYSGGSFTGLTKTCQIEPSGLITVNGVGTIYPRRWCQGTSNSGDQSATAGTFYYVSLTNTLLVTNNSSIFDSASGGIRVKRKGKYKISGSVYIKTGSGGRGAAHIFDSTGAFSTSTSTELLGNALYGNGTDIVVTIAPKIISLQANHIVHLVARCITAAGTIARSNPSTYLLVEWVEDES